MKKGKKDTTNERKKGQLDEDPHERWHLEPAGPLQSVFFLSNKYPSLSPSPSVYEMQPRPLPRLVLLLSSVVHPCTVSLMPDLHGPRQVKQSMGVRFGDAFDELVLHDDPSALSWWRLVDIDLVCHCFAPLYLPPLSVTISSL